MNVKNLFKNVNKNKEDYLNDLLKKKWNKEDIKNNLLRDLGLI